MRLPGEWMFILAETTKFYGWGPKEALSLTWSELRWWATLARGIKDK